jgi:hypothetical protein
MTTTRRKLIEEKYNLLIKHIETYNINILPPLTDEFDTIDLLFYFNFYFGGCKDNFKEPLLNIIKTKNIIISDDTFNKLYPIIETFLLFFKNLT